MAKEMTKKSSKEASKLQNLSLEQFEKRQEKLSVSYKTAVLIENRDLKNRMQSFDFIKNSIKEFLKEQVDAPLTQEELKKSDDVIVLVSKYRQQCLSVLGRLTLQNYQEMGVRTSKTGRVSAFYILQYLYRYCKEYQEKKQ